MSLVGDKATAAHGGCSWLAKGFANTVSGEETLKDMATNSVWNMNGECIQGVLKGKRLAQIQAYQEFWHSWQSFHPGTTKYNR